MMIPMPLAAAHATFLNWLSRTGTLGDFNPADLPDGELAELRGHVAEMHGDVTNGLNRIDNVIAKRAMARSELARHPAPGDSHA